MAWQLRELQQEAKGSGLHQKKTKKKKHKNVGSELFWVLTISRLGVNRAGLQLVKFMFC